MKIDTSFQFPTSPPIASRVTLLIVMLTCAGILQAQMPGDRQSPMQLPQQMESLKFKTSFEMSTAFIPEEVVEEADTYRWPSFTIDAFMGLPENFVLEGRLMTQFINWQFQLGPKWHYAFSDDLSSYVGADYTLFLGGIGAGAFDNTMVANFLTPNVTLGYDFGRFAVTAKLDASFMLSQKTRAGDIVISTGDAIFNGFVYSVFLEQPLWGDNQFIIGARFNYLKFYSPNWLLFPSMDKQYFIPEVILGIRL